VVAARLAAGCLACRSWLLNADEIERLLRSGALSAPGADTGRARSRAWARRAVRPRRLTVLLYALPLKGALVAAQQRRNSGRGVRVGAAVSIVGLTVAVLRYVFTRPAWLTATSPTSETADARRRPQRVNP